MTQPGFLHGNGLFAKISGLGHIFRGIVSYDRVMDDWLKIPEGRKTGSGVKLCLLIGLTALLFLIIAHRYDDIIRVVGAVFGTDSAGS